MALITLFTAPKPFTDPQVALIQRNAIRCWLSLGSEVEVMLVGEEAGLAEVATELGVKHLRGVACNEYGTPLVSSIFDLARQASASPLLAYLNTDILLLPDFVPTVKQVKEEVACFLLVGQRWDLKVSEDLEFGEGWDRRLKQEIREKGRLHPPGGSDYFVFPRDCFQDLPPFAIGRAGWDNWMIFQARRQGWPVLDASHSLTIVHQDHDYHHLPGGQPHYRLPETERNIALAGGRRRIFSLQDANFRLVEGRLTPIPLKGKKFRREVEIFPLLHLGSNLLGEMAFTVFHPLKAWGEWRGRLGSFLARFLKNGPKISPSRGSVGEENRR